MSFRSRIDPASTLLTVVQARCREEGKGKMIKKRKRSINDLEKDTYAEKEMCAQQEMHSEQHITNDEEEHPSDPEPIQQEATLADVHARCRDEAEGKNIAKGKRTYIQGKN
jgi:hypothetical protein